MSRPIKFRAWEKPVVEGGRTYGGGMYYSKESDEKRACGFIIETNSGYSNDDFEWMQFTGVKDKNGRDIYEGDILRDPQRVAGHQEICVFWSDTLAMWMIHNSPRTWSEDLAHVKDRVEVIGNIYESPELLQESPRDET